MSESRFADEGTLAYIAELEAKCGKVLEDKKYVVNLLMPPQAMTESDLRKLHNEAAAILHLLAAAPQSAPKAEQQEPVAWCVAYDDPRMGRIHSNPSMCEPEVDAHIAKCEGRIVKVPLYAAPPDLAAEVERLSQACRDAYEVWAGSEGIPEPVTCAEAYLYKLLIQMRDEVKKGLK